MYEYRFSQFVGGLFFYLSLLKSQNWYLWERNVRVFLFLFMSASSSAQQQQKLIRFDIMYVLSWKMFGTA